MGNRSSYEPKITSSIGHHIVDVFKRDNLKNHICLLSSHLNPDPQSSLRLIMGGSNALRSLADTSKRLWSWRNASWGRPHFSPNYATSCIIGHAQWSCYSRHLADQVRKRLTVYGRGEAKYHLPNYCFRAGFAAALQQTEPESQTSGTLRTVQDVVWKYDSANESSKDRSF